MPRKIRELRADLRRAGFSERAGKGSHAVWHHPLVTQQVVLAGADGDDAKRYQERILRAALLQLRQAQEANRDAP
jgi:predicted RNA binding protein YcfA (HicA-like mRNA interferase family)